MSMGPRVVLMCKDGSAWALPSAERQSFEGAWVMGKSFWYGTGYFGEPIVVKLGDITGLMEHTADSLARRAEADEEDTADRW